MLTQAWEASKLPCFEKAMLVTLLDIPSTVDRGWGFHGGLGSSSTGWGDTQFAFKNCSGGNAQIWAS